MPIYHEGPVAVVLLVLVVIVTLQNYFIVKVHGLRTVDRGLCSSELLWQLGLTWRSWRAVAFKDLSSQYDLPFRKLENSKTLQNISINNGELEVLANFNSLHKYNTAMGWPTFTRTWTMFKNSCKYRNIQGSLSDKCHDERFEIRGYLQVLILLVGLELEVMAGRYSTHMIKFREGKYTHLQNTFGRSKDAVILGHYHFETADMKLILERFETSMDSHDVAYRTIQAEEALVFGKLCEKMGGKVLLGDDGNTLLHMIAIQGLK
eukprot:Filipodium_phascolosomae@DN1750_c0_g2_i1.p1